jgi:hypothetical protein
VIFLLKEGFTMSLESKLKRLLGVSKKRRGGSKKKKAKKRRTPPRKKNGEFRKRG